MSYKLFIPGPVEVSEKTYKAMATPIVGHRSKDFVKLVEDIMPRLKQLFYTNDPVFLSTSSSWGVMEGAIRNVVKKGVLNCCNGAFADKWYDVSKRCGKNAGELKFDWGKPVDPEALEKELSTGKYDAVTIIHNETSTGTMSDIKALSEVLKKFPDVVSIVDTVSSFSALPIKKDELGIDVMVTGCQKALAIPPGLSFCSVSEKAMQRALIQYRDPKNYALVHEALEKAHRTDLIGYDAKCLIRPRKGEKPGGEPRSEKRKAAPARPEARPPKKPSRPARGANAPRPTAKKAAGKQSARPAPTKKSTPAPPTPALLARAEQYLKRRKK